MRISIIIATFNRSALLDECLDHMSRQRFENGDELVVIDNGSTDATRDVIARHARAFPVPVRHLEERRPGKSHALARGLAVASGDVFAFTDDDVNPAPSWLEALRHAMSSGDLALVGGRVSPRWEPSSPRWLSSALRSGRLSSPLALLDYGDEPLALGPRTVLGANMAIRRDALTAIGGFPTNLGKLRGTLLSGEDHEVCRRIQAAGFKAAYDPSVVVHHFVPASRVSVRYLLRWFFWSGVTNAMLDGDERSRVPGVAGVPRYLLKRFAVALAAAPALAASGRLAGALDRAADAAFTAGYAATCWGLAPALLPQDHSA